MNSQKDALLKKEEKLRKELNQVSDDFEQRLLKVVGLTLLGGLVTYGAYKLLGPNKDKAGKKKSAGKKEEASTLLGGIFGKKNLYRILMAIVPIIISSVKDNKPSE